ncbi:MAG: ribonuclease H-like domain-containing protein [Acidobacteriia bacterium]|nr:ribonuclease H-like domain-containing protein [Terriglobia bacterium]
MNLEEKLKQLKKAAAKSVREAELERQLDYLRRLEQSPRKLPAQRVPKGIEEYVEGHNKENEWGEFFLAVQALPFGRPYGKLRIGDLAGADLGPLRLVFANANLLDPGKLVYLDTETTGLAGGTGTCAFLIGIGALEGSQFVIRQLFLRDYPEEKAALAALAEALESYEGVVTFNGKTFDIPLLETRYSLARLKSPFQRLLHLDALHPARRMWKLRLASCELTNLERHVLGIAREGDVPGSEIPQIYFDYLRSGNAQALQPVFFHNALDIITLAALTVELARALSGEGSLAASSLDLFSLSRILDRARATDRSSAACRQALAQGLPESVEARGLWQLAVQHKRRREHEEAAELWNQLARREEPLALKALEELAIYYEHRRRDAVTALVFTTAALDRLREDTSALSLKKRFARRHARLEKKTQSAENSRVLPASGTS